MCQTTSHSELGRYINWFKRTFYFHFKLEEITSLTTLLTGYLLKVFEFEQFHFPKILKFLVRVVPLQWANVRGHYIEKTCTYALSYRNHWRHIQLIGTIGLTHGPQQSRAAQMKKQRSFSGGRCTSVFRPLHKQINHNEHNWLYYVLDI